MQKTIKLARDVEIVKAGKTDRVVLHYTDLNGNSYTPGTPDKIGALAVKLDPDTLGVVKTAKAGQVLTIEMVKDDKYWNLTKASTGSTGVASPHVAAVANGVGFTPAAKKPFDDVGVKVGASRNQAIAILGSFKSGGKGTLVEYLNEVDALSYEIVIRQAAQEDNIRADKNPAKASTKSTTDSFVDVDDFFNAP